MFEKLGTTSLSFAWLGSVLIFLAIVCIVFAFYLLYKIWTANPELLKEYRKMRELCDLANSGHKGARLQCEHNPLINKGMRLCEDGVNVESTYSVPMYLFYQIIDP